MNSYHIFWVITKKIIYNGNIPDMDKIIDKFQVREFVELEELNYSNKFNDSYKSILSLDHLNLYFSSP